MIETGIERFRPNQVGFTISTVGMRYGKHDEKTRGPNGTPPGVPIGPRSEKGKQMDSEDIAFFSDTVKTKWLSQISPGVRKKDQ